MMAAKSNLDLVNLCDVFPYPNTPTYVPTLSKLYMLLWDSTPIGYIHESVVAQLEQIPTRLKGRLEVHRDRRTVTLFHDFDSVTARNAIVAAICAYWRALCTFRVLAGWRDELYPVHGQHDEVVCSIERSASALFGVVTYGVHMTAYTRVEGASHGLKIWVPRRARSKPTWGGMLDNTVAGGIAVGENPEECLVREAEEEASFVGEWVRRQAKACGMISYIYVGSDGWVQPECQYVFDLELPEGVVPKPNDGEVEEFNLLSVEDVQKALGRGEFKPNCALVILDFFIRWAILTEENESDYEEIKRRIHRELEFPGPHRA